jgi:hypothetical protein
MPPLEFLLVKVRELEKQRAQLVTQQVHDFQKGVQIAFSTFSCVIIWGPSSRRAGDQHFCRCPSCPEWRKKEGELFFPSDAEREETQRTRSFMFLAIAALAARRSGGCILQKKMAERVGFEPTCPLLAGKTLSRRPRYDHFGTSPSKFSHRIIELLSDRVSYLIC